MIWALRHWRVLAVLGALSGLFYGGWYVRGYVERASDMRAQLAAERKAAVAALKYYAERDVMDHALDEQAREFSQMEGRDARLSNHLRHAAERLWP